MPRLAECPASSHDKSETEHSDVDDVRLPLYEAEEDLDDAFWFIGKDLPC